MLKESIVYVFNVNLIFMDETTDYITFKVIGNRELGGLNKAKQKLLEYLETEGHKEFKYKECVGIREMPSDSVLIDTSENKTETVEAKDVILDTYNNLMICPHCNEIINTAHDWTPNYCKECGNPLSGGNQYKE